MTDTANIDDTVKIERPMCCRRHEDLGGRVKQDPQGNSMRVKTRVHDSLEDFSSSWLEQTIDLERSAEG